MLTVTAADEVDAVVRLVAAIWARAKARRDDLPAPDHTDVDLAVSGVRRRLALEGSTLLTARHEDEVVGFALCARSPRGLELFYLAVDPDAWGRHIASALLESVDRHARAEQLDEVELWVIDDNARAIRAYERAGYRPTDDLVTDPTSGRPERRLVRRLA